MTERDLRYKNVFRCNAISAVDGFLPVRDVLKYEMFGDEGDKGFRNFDGVLDDLKRLIPGCDDHFMEMLFESIQTEQLDYDDEYRYNFTDYLIKLLISECKVPEEYFNYGIWACENPEDVVDSYNVNLEDVSKYKIKGVMLQDLGEEGALYGCKDYPEEVFDESVAKKTMSLDFNSILELAKMQETKLASKEAKLDVVYKWLPFLKVNAEIMALDKYVNAAKEPLEILFDCKSKGDVVNYKEDPDLWKAVNFRNQAMLIEAAMDEYSDIYNEASKITDGKLDRNVIINNLSKLAQESTYLNYLFLQSVAPSVNTNAKQKSGSKYIKNPELKKYFLKGIKLEDFENPESDIVLFGYLNVILGNTLFNTLNGARSQEKFEDNSGTPLNKNNDNSPFISMLKQLKAQPFDENPTFIPTSKSSKDGKRGYLGLNTWSIKLAKGEVTEDELKDTLDPEEFKAAMEGLEDASKKWGTKESKQPIELFYSWATAVWNNQLKNMVSRAKSAERKQQQAEEKLLADRLEQESHRLEKPYSSEEEKWDMEAEYGDNVEELYSILKTYTQYVSDDPKVWMLQYKKAMKQGEPSFAPQLSAFIAGMLLNPDAAVTTVFEKILNIKVNDLLPRMPSLGFDNLLLSNTFIYLQNHRSLVEYSEKAKEIFDGLINRLEKLSGITVSREPVRIFGQERNKVWKNYGKGIITNNPPKVGSSWANRMGIKESKMIFNDEEFEQIFNECVTAGGMGGCINNFVPQNVLAVTDTKMGAISPGVTKGKILKSGENPDFENDSMKVHKKGKKKGDAITGTGIVYAKDGKFKESSGHVMDDEDLYEYERDYGNTECSRCGADCSEYGVMIRGDIYCRSCAESEMRDDDDDENYVEPPDYCPRCGKVYDLHDNSSYGIAKGHIWCATCAEELKRGE